METTLSRSKSGTLFKYNMKSGHFGVTSADGIIQSFYKLDVSKGMK